MTTGTHVLSDISRPESPASMLVPLVGKVQFPSSPQAWWHSMKPDALSCWADHWTGDEDNQDQVMLSAEKFQSQADQAELNQTEPSQSIAADGEWPLPITLEGEEPSSWKGSITVLTGKMWLLEPTP